MPKLSARTMLLTGLLTTTALANTACFGSFPLTRKVYGFNKGVSDDKFVRELVFLAIGVLVPVYSVAGLIDVVILNSMEFWTGKETKLSAAPETKVKTLTRGDVTITQTLTTAATGRTMVLEEQVNGAFRSRTVLHQAPGAKTVTSETTFADGRVEKKSLTLDEAGAMTISSTTGLPRTLSADEANALTSRVDQLQQRGVAFTR
jgi:hypothetical protein